MASPGCSWNNGSVCLNNKLACLLELGFHSFSRSAIRNSFLSRFSASYLRFLELSWTLSPLAGSKFVFLGYIGVHLLEIGWSLAPRVVSMFLLELG